MHLNVLLVDDHIIITDFYKMTLSGLKVNTKITTANTLEAAYKFIFTKSRLQTIDVIILDLSMPPYREENIANGEDLGKLIRLKFPKVKIVIISSLFSSVQIERITEAFSPEGLIEKIDITNSEYLLDAVDKITRNKSYKSEMIEKRIQSNILNDTKFDTLNKQIISLLSQGVKTKNLPNHLSMTLSAVNKRKSKIKQLLHIEHGDDEDIVKESKKIGII